MKKLSWTGKTLWITGASSGIGAALAIEASKRGAALLLSGRNAEALEDVSRQCSPAKTAVLPFDLSDRHARAQAASIAPELLGRIDVLILNAGVSQRSRFFDTSKEVVDRIMETNFFASVDLVRACLPGMAASHSGQIVAVSSVAGLMGAPWRTAYSASKFALGGFLSSLRAELQGTGISVTVAYPGFVRTMISVNALGPSGLPHGRMDPLQESGMEPALAARRIADAAESGRAEIRVAFDAKASLGVFLSRHTPALFARSISRHGGL